MNFVISYLVGLVLVGLIGATTDQIIQNVYDSSNLAFRANIVTGSLAPAGNVGDLQTKASASTLAAYGGTGACGAGTAVTALSSSGAATCTAFGGGSVTGSGTTNAIPAWSSATALGDSNLTNNASGVTIGTKATQQNYTNNAVTGTTTNKPVKNDGSGNVIVTNSSTDAIKGICVEGCGTSGTAKVAVSGAGVSCVFAGTATAGHFVTTNASGECVDGGASFPTDSSSVIGTVNTGGVGAGTYTIDLNGMDVASASSGGGGGGNKNPAGAAGNVQYRATGNNFAAESNFTYDATNNRLALTGLTTATDAATKMVDIAGTLPAVPTSDVAGTLTNITSAGSAGFAQIAAYDLLSSGYTGSSATRAHYVNNQASGTGSTLNLNSSSETVANFGQFAITGGTGTGTFVSLYGGGGQSATTNIGGLGKQTQTVAGNNIGLMGAAGGSTEATGLKDVGVYAVINGGAALVAANVSAALLADNGSGTGSIARWYDNGTYKGGILDGGKVDVSLGTATGDGIDVALTSSGSATQIGVLSIITGAGSTADVATYGMYSQVAAGYTGNGYTFGAILQDLSANTGTDFGWNSADNAPKSSVGAYATASRTGTGAGTKTGVLGNGYGSTTTNFGAIGKAQGTIAGSNIAVLGAANNSTEATDWKDVGVMAVIGNGTAPVLTGVNASVALVARTTGSNDIMRGYNDSTLDFSVASDGAISTASSITSSATSSLGWSVQNVIDQACNTTCTSACVAGFADGVSGDDITSCTDATADHCLCAGAS